MLSERLLEAFTEQTKWEFHSAYLYLAMAAYLEGRALEGMARWMKAQSVEETTHALKFYNFLHDRGHAVVLREIPAPPSSWESPLQVFEAALEHEKEVTRRINHSDAPVYGRKGYSFPNISPVVRHRAGGGGSQFHLYSGKAEVGAEPPSGPLRPG